jgi:hypothetical protein
VVCGSRGRNLRRAPSLTRAGMGPCSGTANAGEHFRPTSRRLHPAGRACLGGLRWSSVGSPGFGSRGLEAQGIGSPGDRKPGDQKSGGRRVRGRRVRTAGNPPHAEPRSEPVAAVSKPPARIKRRDGCPQCPPERQSEISHQAQQGEADPENLLLHASILVPIPSPSAFLSRAEHIQRCNGQHCTSGFGIRASQLPRRR